MGIQGNDPNCRKTSCKYLKNGDCYHTTNEAYAAKDTMKCFIKFDDETELEIPAKISYMDDKQAKISLNIESED